MKQRFDKEQILHWTSRGFDEVSCIECKVANGAQAASQAKEVHAVDGSGSQVKKERDLIKFLDKSSTKSNSDN